MSYARQNADARPTGSAVSSNGAASDGGRPLLSGAAAAGESTYVEEHRRTVELVKKIQSHVADIQKQTQQLNAPNASATIADRRKKVQDSVKAATEIAREADTLLKGIAVEARGISLQEQKLRQAKKQKLTENLHQSSEQLQMAFRSYEKREEEVQAAAAQAAAATAAAAAAASAATARRSSPSARTVRGKADARQTGMEDESAVELGEGGPRQQLQEMDAHEAELDMHGAIVTEFTTEVTTLEEDIRSVAYSMRTMASLAATQGEVLDNIESNMGRAEEQSTSAVEQIVQASVTQRTGNKRLWWILLFTILLAIVLVLFLINRRH